MDELVALAERLQARCRATGVRVATAESCTGGMIAGAITSVPGSSDYFLGGVVVYSDALKRALLGVNDALLASHGAVSAQVAVAMAHGARARTGADLAVAVTGISGPGGGTEDKPVGLTYVAVAGQAADVVRRFSWHGDRQENRVASARAALELLLEVAAPPPTG